MLNRLKKMIDGFAGSDRAKPDVTADDHKLAAASLLVHATLVDGDLANSEQIKLQDLLEKNYELSPAEALELISLAKEEDKKAIDLYGFTRRLARTLELDQRLEIIEMLWEIAYADGVLHEFEQNLIWRVAELMHVETRERVRLRQKVQARLDIKS